MPDNHQDLMPYNLFYVEDRLLAQNIDGHVVDIGGATREEGHFHWQLDGNDEQGMQSATVDAMLSEVEQHLSFLFLDGQFTSLEDQSERYGEALENAPSRQIVLHELSDRDEGEIR